MNWIEIKALNSLYRGESVKKNDTLAKSKQIDYLVNSLKVLGETTRLFVPLSGFSEIYEHTYLSNYQRYVFFLESENLLKPQTRFEERDIETLIRIRAIREEEIIIRLRQRILEGEESLRSVSLMFFKNEKYLDNKPSLVEAVKFLLDVTEFSNDKDQQYIYKLECHDPKAIVLCENLDFLTKPLRPRKYGIELWYVGGKNVPKLDFSDTRGLPIYYSCDWDYDGLFVIYPLVKRKIPAITLLTPNGSPRGIIETDHNSSWRSNSPLPEHITEHQFQIVESLIRNNQWIIEESNDLIEMLTTACEI